MIDYAAFSTTNFKLKLLRAIEILWPPQFPVKSWTVHVLNRLQWVGHTLRKYDNTFLWLCHVMQSAILSAILESPGESWSNSYMNRQNWSATKQRLEMCKSINCMRYDIVSKKNWLILFRNISCDDFKKNLHSRISAINWAQRSLDFNPFPYKGNIKSNQISSVR